MQQPHQSGISTETDANPFHFGVALIAAFLLSMSLIPALAFSAVVSPDHKKIESQLVDYVAYQFCKLRLSDVGDGDTSLVLAFAEVKQRFSALVRLSGVPARQAVLKRARGVCPYAFDQVVKLKVPTRQNESTEGLNKVVGTACEVTSSDQAKLLRTGRMTIRGRDCLIKIGQ